MPTVFTTLDKMRPAYDVAYKVTLFVCKILLILDIVIASFAVATRLPFMPAAPWSEEIVLTLMSYMAVLSAALAIRRRAHIRMTAFDKYLPKTLVKILDIVADVAVLALAVIMLTYGWEYATTLGAFGSYISMPWLSRFWMYLPIPVAGIAMIIFEIESIYLHIRSFFVNDEEVQN